jgi:hypothetical protein
LIFFSDGRRPDHFFSSHHAEFCHFAPYTDRCPFACPSPHDSVTPANRWLTPYPEALDTIAKRKSFENKYLDNQSDKSTIISKIGIKNAVLLPLPQSGGLWTDGE